MRTRPNDAAGRAIASAATVAAILALVFLGGCISLLPKQKPAQLYRFGGGVPVGVAPTGGPARITIRAAPTGFERAAAADRILTVTGDQTAYIAGARWVIAASTLFEDAVTAAFEAHGGPARLLARDEPVVADYVLKLDVQTFEVRYAHGGGAAPSVVVQLYAALAERQSTNGVSRLFQVETPAASNSVHAITAAFDMAVSKILDEMVAWAESQADPAAKGQAQANPAG